MGSSKYPGGSINILSNQSKRKYNYVNMRMDRCIKIGEDFFSGLKGFREKYDNIEHVGPETQNVYPILYPGQYSGFYRNHILKATIH